MRITVLLFAAYREALGRSRLQVDLPEGSSADELYGTLAAGEPRLLALRPYTTFAVNREVVSPGRILAEGDEVALLQPASGGTA